MTTNSPFSSFRLQIYIFLVPESSCDGAGNPIFSQTGTIQENSPQHLFSWKMPDLSSSGRLILYLKAKVFYCDESKACKMKEKVFMQELNFESSGASKEVQFKFPV